MDRKLSIGIFFALATALMAIDLYAAVAVPGDANTQAESVNSPTAAEPVIPGTLDKPPQPVAPGTLDAPPKPVAPGTLDKNVINPDDEIRKGEKPIFR